MSEIVGRGFQSRQGNKHGKRERHKHRSCITFYVKETKCHNGPEWIEGFLSQWMKDNIQDIHFSCKIILFRCTFIQHRTSWFQHVHQQHWYNIAGLLVLLPTMEQVQAASCIWQLSLNSSYIKNNRQLDKGNCWWDIMAFAFRRPYQSRSTI